MTEHTLKRGDVTVHYEANGNRSEHVPLLLTHGYGASSAMWRPNLDALGVDRLVITWDVRGHGLTTAPPDLAGYTHEASVADMAAILDDQGIDRAVIGGLSLGGYLSLEFRAAHPERTVALVLCDTGPGFKSDRRREGWNAFARQQADDLEQGGEGALRDSPEVRAARHDPTGLALAARGILTQRDSSVIESLPSIGVPTLVVVGDRDEPFLAAADYMATTIPGAAKQVIADAGHACNIDQPKAFDAAVVDFLHRVDGQSGSR